MEDQRPNTAPQQSDEIDLGQLFRMIGNGLNNLFKAFLRFFNYLKRNALILGGLLVLGVVAAVIVNNLRPKRLKTEVIVKPNFDSTDYLYDVVEEIKANLANQDTSFFKSFGLDTREIGQLVVEINPIDPEEGRENIEDEIKYLQLLRDLQADAVVQDILKAEILRKSIVNHKITFYYNNGSIGSEQARTIMDYINSNVYFNELRNIYTNNANSKIEANEQLIGQIDTLISGFSKTLSQDTKEMGQGTILLDSEKGLDVPTLLSLKNGLIKENERKRLDLLQQKEIVQIVNFGKTQPEKRPFLRKRIVMYPLLLLSLFFLISILGMLDRRSKSIS